MDREQQRIKRILGFMDRRGFKYNCECGKSHAVDLKLFEEENGRIKPRRVVKLECAYFFQWLQGLNSLSIKANAKAGDGHFYQACSRAYIWVVMKWLNR